MDRPLGSGSSLWSDGKAGPRQKRLERIFRGTFALYSVGSYLVMAFLAGGFRLGLSSALLVLLAVMATAAVLVVLRARPWISVALLGGAVVAAATSPEAGVDLPFLLGVLGYAAAVQLRLRAAAATILMGAVVAAVLVWRADGSDFASTVDGLVLVVALTVTGSAYLCAFVDRVARLDEVRLQRVAAETDQRIRNAEMVSDSNLKRLIHDELIGTIRAVADVHPGGEDVVRRACRDAVDAVTAARISTSESTLAEVIAWCDLRSTVRLTIHVEDPDRMPSLPVSHADAVRRALAEALRNVDRHSGVREATVRARLDGDWFTLEVSDAGSGTHGQSRRSWGVTNSLRAPIDWIGGRVDIDSRGRRGTDVVMRWPAPCPASPPRRSRLLQTQRQTLSAAGGDARLAMWVALPVLLAHSYVGVRNSWGDAGVMGELTLGAAWFAATLWLVIMLRRAAAGYATIAGAAVLSGAAVAVGLRLAEQNPLVSHDSWIIGLTSVGLIMVAFFTPPIVGLACVTPAVLVVAGRALNDGAGLQSAGAFNAVLMPAVIAILLGHLLRRVGADVESEEAQLAELTAQLHRQRIISRDEERQLAYLERKVVPWLQSAAVARLDQVVRREAELLAAELRDELYLPGILDEALKARLWTSRRDGLRVDIEAPEHPPADVAVALRTLDRVLDIRTLTSVVLSLPTEGSHGAWSLATFPALDGDQRDHATGSIAGLPCDAATDGITSTITVGPLITLVDPRAPDMA